MSRYSLGHDIRPRVDCQECGRSIAVTFNAVNGDAYVRSHVQTPGERCAGSGRTIPSRDVSLRTYYRGEHGR